MALVYYPILINEPAVYAYVAETFAKWDSEGVTDSLAINNKTVLRFEMKDVKKAHTMTEQIGGFVDPLIYRVDGGRVVFLNMWCEEHVTPDKWHFINDVLLIEGADDFKRLKEAFPRDEFAIVEFERPARKRSVL